MSFRDAQLLRGHRSQLGTAANRVDGRPFENGSVGVQGRVRLRIAMSVHLDQPGVQRVDTDAGLGGVHLYRTMLEFWKRRP